MKKAGTQETEGSRATSHIHSWRTWHWTSWSSFHCFKRNKKVSSLLCWTSIQRRTTNQGTRRNHMATRILVITAKTELFEKRTQALDKSWNKRERANELLKIKFITALFLTQHKKHFLERSFRSGVSLAKIFPLKMSSTNQNAGVWSQKPSDKNSQQQNGKKCAGRKSRVLRENVDKSTNKRFCDYWISVTMGTRIFSHPFTIASRLLECSHGVPWILDRGTLNAESSQGFVKAVTEQQDFIRELVTAVKTAQDLISLPRFIRVWTSQRENRRQDNLHDLWPSDFSINRLVVLVELVLQCGFAGVFEQPSVGCLSRGKDCDLEFPSSLLEYSTSSG